MGGSFCLGSNGGTGSGVGSGSVKGTGSATGLAAWISEISISIFEGCLILTGLILGGLIAFKAFRSSTARARAFAS